MIAKWKLFNFKSIRKETELEMAPLTILAGANSSGKSTFLQSILLVAQTLAHKVSSRSVVLNGALARLGQFDDLKSVESEADQITIGWTCHLPSDFQESHALGYRRMAYYYLRGKQRVSAVSCEIAFDTKDVEAQREIAQIQPPLFSTQLSVSTRDPEAGDSQFSMTIRRTPVGGDASKRKWIDTDAGNEPTGRRSLQYDVEVDDASLADIREELVSAEPVGCVLRHFLPERLALGVDLVAEDAQAILNVLAGEGVRGFPRRSALEREVAVPASVVDFVMKLTSDLGGDAKEDVQALLLKHLHQVTERAGGQPVALEGLNDALRRLPARFRMELRRRMSEEGRFEAVVKEAIHKERKEEPALVPFRLPRAIAEASWYIDQFFASSVRYLGPLRDEPKSLYPLSPTASPLDVGLKGEHTAAVLELHKNSPIRYIPTSAFAGDEISPQATTRSLEAAVIDWLRYLGVAEHVESRDKGKFGHELTVSIAGSKRPHDLTHVGVGVSQVLPILVASLLAEPDTTLIFEQPELHLHPKVQTLLADFFLSMTQLGKQCLIETHSEYLINRIRFRTAAAQMSNPWVAAVKMYFVEKTGDGTAFREVSINEFGAITDWPEGFFDQSQREAEAILRAAVLKRKSQREK